MLQLEPYAASDRIATAAAAAAAAVAELAGAVPFSSTCILSPVAYANRRWSWPGDTEPLRLEQGVDEQSDDGAGESLRDDASRRPSSASIQNDAVFDLEDLDGERLASALCFRSSGLAEYRTRGGHESSSTSDRDMTTPAVTGRQSVQVTPRLQGSVGRPYAVLYRCGMRVPSWTAIYCRCCCCTVVRFYGGAKLCRLMCFCMVHVWSTAVSYVGGSG